MAQGSLGWATGWSGPVAYSPARRAVFSEDEARRRSMATVGRVADTEAHELGNLLVGVSLTLQQLRGCQHSGKQEEILEQALQAVDQSVDAARALLEATRSLLKIASDRPVHAESAL